MSVNVNILPHAEVAALSPTELEGIRADHQPHESSSRCAGCTEYYGVMAIEWPCLTHDIVSGALERAGNNNMA